MSIHVTLQVVFVAELPATDVTFVQHLASMYSHVSSQLCRRAAAFTTELAVIRIFSSVQPLVDGQVA